MIPVGFRKRLILSMKDWAIVTQGALVWRSILSYLFDPPVFFIKHLTYNLDYFLNLKLTLELALTSEYLSSWEQLELKINLKEPIPHFFFFYPGFCRRAKLISEGNMGQGTGLGKWQPQFSFHKGLSSSYHSQVAICTWNLVPGTYPYVPGIFVFLSRIIVYV